MFRTLNKSVDITLKTTKTNIAAYLPFLRLMQSTEDFFYPIDQLARWWSYVRL